MIRCSQCKRELSPDCFYKNKSRKNGFDNWCKDCKQEYRQSEKGKKYFSNYRKTGKVKEGQKKYYSTIRGILNARYHNILTRCNNPNCKRYEDWGGRGIRCLFESFNDFYDYVVNHLQVNPIGLQIDRINNDGNYERGNIRFVTPKINANNRRNKVNNN